MPVHEVRVAWTSDAAGAATSVIKGDSLNGTIARVTTIPDATDAPDDNYDVTLVDGDSVDLFFGYGADRDTSTTETFVPLISQTIDGLNYQRCTVAASRPATLTIANAGASNKGVVSITIEE